MIFSLILLLWRKKIKSYIFWMRVQCKKFFQLFTISEKRFWKINIELGCNNCFTFYLENIIQIWKMFEKWKEDVLWFFVLYQHPVLILNHFLHSIMIIIWCSWIALPYYSYSLFILWSIFLGFRMVSGYEFLFYYWC